MLHIAVGKILGIPQGDGGPLKWPSPVCGQAQGGLSTAKEYQGAEPLEQQAQGQGSRAQDA